MREMRVLFAHTAVVLFLLTAGYYVLPLRVGDHPDTYLRLGLSVVLLVGLAVVLRMQVRRSRRAQRPPYLRIQWLLTAMYVLILGFALVYAVIAVFLPSQFVGIDDRTDALYFSVTLVGTVGFGDIHPSGTVGQLAATVHMVFNLIFLGTALRLLTTAPGGASGAREATET